MISVNQSVISAQEKQKENAPWIESPSTGESWDVRSVTPPRSTKVRRAPEFFEGFTKVAVEDLVTIKNRWKDLIENTGGWKLK